jgi:hypothetical protein
VVRKVEKAVFLMFVPFFIKRWVLLVSECHGKKSQESLRQLAMVAEAEEESMERCLSVSAL